MLSPSDPRPALARVPAVLLLLLLVFAGALSAQPVNEADESLRAQLEERFQVLELADGVALVPLESLNGVRSIELRGESVVINGAPVGEQVLRSWLQQAAPPVLALSRLPAERRRALFGFTPLEARPGPAEPAAASEPSSELVVEPAAPPDPPAPPAPATPDSPIVEEPEAPAAERAVERATHNSGTRTAFGQGLVIEAHEIADEAVSIGGPLTIDGEVTDSALAVGGPLRIRGRVLGDVAAIGGPVYLESGSEVHGDVVTIGGTVERAPGARVFGEVSDVAVDLGDLDFDFDFDDLFAWEGWRPSFPRIHSPFSGLHEAVVAIAWLILVALVVGAVVLLARRPVERIAQVAGAEPWKAGLVGLLAALTWLVVMPFVALILIITIIGIPILLLLLFATFLLALVGYSAVAYRLGGVAARRFGWTALNAFLLACLGVLLLRGWSVLGDLFGLGGWPLFLPAITLAFFGFIVNFAAWSVGVGALLLSAFGSSAPAPLPPVPRPADPAPLPPLPDTGPGAETALADLPPEDELEREFESLAAEPAPLVAPEPVDPVDPVEPAGPDAEPGSESSWDDREIAGGPPDEEDDPAADEDPPPPRRDR